jgi:phenylacetate-coenzyme A ligase PaaK-like adenylate-forming protein
LNIPAYIQRIFSIRSEDEFTELALEAFRYQAEQNPVYAEFVRLLNIVPGSVRSIDKIPFLPIELFKSHRILTGTQNASLCFRSSGTTGSRTSEHHVADPAVYEKSFLEAFRLFFGEPSSFCFLALLPSYLERNDSSLVYMADRLVRESSYSQSGFYLHADEELVRIIRENEEKQIPTFLFGVTFALLDLAEKFPMPLHHTRIIETGGMKGRRKELTRPELHGILQQAFGKQQILSEYGMTELLSQAYLLSGEDFSAPPWMKIMIRETGDPLSWTEEGRTGGISVIDLANIHSCCFIATQDLGKKTSPGTFTVLGRYDNSDIRGCNLMVG